MVFVDIPEADTKAGEPIDETLMAKINDDLDYLYANQGSGGGGGGVSIADSGSVAVITDGGEDNCAKYWKRRFHISESSLTNKDGLGFNPSESRPSDRFIGIVNNATPAQLVYGADASCYLGQYLQINKGYGIKFNVKKGENFFSIGFIQYTDRSDSIEILIDGQTPSSLGLTNENGSVQSNTFSSNGILLYQKQIYFYGLDGNPHTISIKNTDSGSRIFTIEFVEVGYRSENPTINHDIIIQKGKSSGRNGSVDFIGTKLSFPKPTGNGYTGAVVADSAGLLTVLDGLDIQPAMTQAKPLTTVTWGTDAASPATLNVKNNFYFPSSGIILVSTIYGQHYLASYSGKGSATIQAHTLTGMVWESKPTEDYIPFNNPQNYDANGEINLNLWGTAPILIDSTNNKIDFSITKDGVTTSHTATIANGRYAADLVKLDTAIKKAMNSIKPIEGTYYARYSASTQLWEIGISDTFNTSISFQFASGPSAASSIASTLGFPATDLTGTTSYIATTAKQHLSSKVFEAEDEIRGLNSPMVKKSYTDTVLSDASTNDARSRLNLPVVTQGTGFYYDTNIYPDNDCIGIAVTFIAQAAGSGIEFQVDNSESCYILNTMVNATSGIGQRAQLLTAFISFPAGSRKIRFSNKQYTTNGAVGNGGFRVAGFRQYFSKPKWESLPLNKAIIKTYLISPISLYATEYMGAAGALYSPQSSNDNINTITESGTWAPTQLTASFNNYSRINTTVNGYIEVDFTLQGNGGGIGLKIFQNGVNPPTAIKLFISQSAIVEGTDLISITGTASGTGVSTIYDYNSIRALGLSAGTYKARFKNESASQFGYVAVMVYDTIPPQINANTLTQVANTGQGVTYPINVRRMTLLQDSGANVPAYLSRTGYKEGQIAKASHISPVVTVTNQNDVSGITTNNNQFHYDSFYIADPTGVYREISIFCKSISTLDGCSQGGYGPLMTQFIDGVQGVNTYSQGVQLKGGSSPASARFSASRLFSKIFSLPCTFSSGSTYNISDTRGINVGMNVILNDGTSTEEFTIASIVVGVSFTITQTPAVVVPANVTNVDFSGFHNLRIVNGAAASAIFSAFEYEPLPISFSKALSRLMAKTDEISKITFKGVVNGQSLYFPTFSDGSSGTPNNSAISCVALSAASAFTIPDNLLGIVVTTGTVNVSVSSFKKVSPIQIEDN